MLRAGTKTVLGVRLHYLLSDLVLMVFPLNIWNIHEVAQGIFSGLIGLTEGINHK